MEERGEMKEPSEREIKERLAELAKQQGLKSRDKWPVYMWAWKEEKWGDVVAWIDHVWYVEIKFNGETWPLPVVAFEIVNVGKLLNLSRLKTDLENIRLSGAALGVMVIQAHSEDALDSYVRARLERLRNIMMSLAHPVRIGIAYAGDIVRGKLPVRWLSILY